MDVQLKELIDRIKTDGVKSAEDKAARILSDAEVKAENILAKAEAEAARIRESAKADADKTTRTGQEALRQAGRDLILSVRGQLEVMFQKVLVDETNAALTKDVMAETIKKAVEALTTDTADISVLVSGESLDVIEKGLRSKFSEKAAEGLEIKASKDLSGGFRIAMKDGSAFYDYSDQEIAEVLGRYLNPRLSSLLSN